MNHTAHPPHRHACRFVSLQLVVLLFVALATSGFAPASKQSVSAPTTKLAASFRDRVSLQGSPTPTIAAEGKHTCAVISDGVKCWGDN